MSSSLFDRFIFLVVAALALALGLVIWRGDQVGVRVMAVSPADGATAVSTAATIHITFDQPVEASPEYDLVIEPPVSGSLRAEGRQLTFSPATRLNPDTTYTVTLPAGLPGQQGREVLRPLTWRFATGHTRVLYLGWDGDGRSQIFVVDPAGGEPVQLTQETDSILDYSLSPDGLAIAYTIQSQEGAADLRLIDTDGNNRRLLLNCPDAACSQPVWSPDGRRLLYERRQISQTGAVPGAPRLWWLDPVSAATSPVFQDSQLLAFGARFSPDGRWLSYVVALDQAIQVVNLEDGRLHRVPTQVGVPAAWSPQSDSLLLTDVRFQAEEWTVHLIRLDLDGLAQTDLSGIAQVDDNGPAWSPDGAWVALARKGARETAGRQVWLLRPDGAEAHPVTAAPEFQHGPPHWSPDGRWLVFQRHSLTEPGADPTIWLLEMATGELRQVAAAGMQPAWLP
ncbi:MAG: Ig-like domain-containing protein [Chloroflexota bacterium]